MGKRIAFSRSLASTVFELFQRDVIILGGGLAGISAAVRLLEHEVKATLVEQRPFLGGRAFSFRDRASNEEIDNGQHVILGVCNEFLQLLTVIGTRDELELGAALDVPVSFGGEVVDLRANRFSGNLNALARYSHLNLSDRFSIARLLAKLKLRLVDIDRNPTLRDISFAKWLSDQGQSQHSIDWFWSLFILPVFNCHVSQLVAKDAIEFVRIALLGKARETAIGYPRVGLSSLVGEPALQYLSAHDVEVRTGTRVSSISRSNSGDFVVEMSGGEAFHCQQVIAALPPNAIVRVLPPSDDQFAATRATLMHVEYSPIVAVHLWYEKPVMAERVMAFLDLGIQWVFNDSALRAKSNDESQHIVISLSGADDWVALDKPEILRHVTSAMRIAFPLTNSIEIVNSGVVKTLEATVKLGPGSSHFRFGPGTEVPGFYVAGDWTDTGLPATMAGAVLSGNTAADMLAARMSGEPHSN